MTVGRDSVGNDSPGSLGPPYSGPLLSTPATHIAWPGEGTGVELSGNGGTAAIRLSLGDAADHSPAECKPQSTYGIRIVLPVANAAENAQVDAYWATEVCTTSSAFQFSASGILSKRTTTNTGWQDGH